MTVKTGPFKAAVMEADVLADLTDSKRLETCQYTEGYIATGGRKHTQETLKLNTGKKQRQQKEAVNCKAVSKLGSAQDLASLEKVLSQSNFDLKEFIQTNFKIDSNGTVSLATSPKCADAKVKDGKQARQRRRKTATCSQSDGVCGGTPQPKPGRRPRRKNRNANCAHVAAGKRISPTIPDYFNTLTPTSTGCSSNMVHTTQEVRSSHEVDQVVPGGVSAEAQAMRELEEIEGLLTMFEDNGSKKKPFRESGSEMEPGGGSDLTLIENSQSKRTLERACEVSKMKSGEERADGSYLEESDNTHSEWMESMLGEIDQIEGMYVHCKLVRANYNSLSKDKCPATCPM